MKNKDVIRSLNERFDVNNKNLYEISPIHAEILYKHDRNMNSTLMTQLQAGANPNTVRTGNIHLLFDANRFTNLIPFIRAGINVNVTNQEGKNILQLRNNSQSILLILKALPTRETVNAALNDPNANDSVKYHLRKYLRDLPNSIQRGQQLLIESKKSEPNTNTVTQLIGNYADTKVRDEQGWQSLQYFAFNTAYNLYNYEYPIWKALPLVNTTTNAGWSTLMILMNSDFSPSTIDLQKLFEDQPFVINYAMPDGLNALFVAINKNNYTKVKGLLDNGAKTNVTYQGLTPLEFARHKPDINQNIMRQLQATSN